SEKFVNAKMVIPTRSDHDRGHVGRNVRLAPHHRLCSETECREGRHEHAIVGGKIRQAAVGSQPNPTHGHVTSSAATAGAWYPVSVSIPGRIGLANDKRAGRRLLLPRMHAARQTGAPKFRSSCSSSSLSCGSGVYGPAVGLVMVADALAGWPDVTTT